MDFRFHGINPRAESDSRQRTQKYNRFSADGQCLGIPKEIEDFGCLGKGAGFFIGACFGFPQRFFLVTQEAAPSIQVFHLRRVALDAHNGEPLRAPCRELRRIRVASNWEALQWAKPTEASVMARAFAAIATKSPNAIAPRDGLNPRAALSFRRTDRQPEDVRRFESESSCTAVDIRAQDRSFGRGRDNASSACRQLIS